MNYADCTTVEPCRRPDCDFAFESEHRTIWPESAPNGHVGEEPAPPPHPVETADAAPPVSLPVPVNWAELFAQDRTAEDWLIEDLWPRRRLISLTAPRKARKSLLMLYLAVCLARGRCPWSGRERPPRRVLYLDLEMTEDDLLERVEDMGVGPGDLDGLRYFLHPTMPMLDTPEGGKTLLGLIDAHGAEAVVIDTFSRVVTSKDHTGHEVREFYRWSAQHVKSRGASLARLDHTGHAVNDRAAGSAAKGADVDVGWVLHPGDLGTMTLRHHGLTRVRWVPESIELTVSEEPLRFGRAAQMYVEGTADAARDLDRLSAPLDITSAAAQKVLRDAGCGYRRQVVQHAIRYRREGRP